MKHLQNANSNESKPTDVVAVDSQPPTKTKKMKIFIVRTIQACGRKPSLRTFQIAATGLRDAKDLAQALVWRLRPEQYEAITVDALSVGLGIDDVEIFDGWKTHGEFPTHTWNRNEIETEDIDQIVIGVIEELATL
jgi:hypothetical protein